MAVIFPFKAIRPTRDKAHLIATRPVFTYKKNILKAKLEENPYTFIRIIHPEFNKEVKTKPNSKERFLKVREKFEEFFKKGYFIKDERAHFYIYRQTTTKNTFTGLICGASVAEYENDKIKKHEATLTAREEMFTNYLDIVGFNAEPVLLSYQGNASINSILNEIIKSRPEYEFSTTDYIKHELWLVPNEYSEKLKDAFGQVPALYIADGHHRSASSFGLYNRKNKENSKNELHDYFLSFLIDENELNILEFNRIVKHTNGLSEKEFISQLEKSFSVKKINQAQKPNANHKMTMCFEGTWYELQFKANCIEESHPIKSLDSALLTDYVLNPILNIKDLKTDANIDFVSGNIELSKIEEMIQSKKFKIAFVLYPATIDQVKKVADNQMIMPPKSTWVEPKLRSGLTIYSYD